MQSAALSSPGPIFTLGLKQHYSGGMRRKNKLRIWFQQKPQPMTKQAFAEAVGCTPSYVSQLCRDSPPWPGRALARRIGEVTGGAVRPDDLAGYDGAPGDSFGPPPIETAA